MKRPSGWYWPWLLTAGLLAVVGVNVVMLFVASSDRNGVVVEPDYYRKAVSWDSTLALRAASGALGWSATTELILPSSVAVQLRDSLGGAVAGARMRVTLIHNNDAGRPIELTLLEAPAGSYSANVALVHRGRWEVRVDAERGPDRFVTVLHTTLAP